MRHRDLYSEGEEELRRNQRELYAYHFTIFPNRKYNRSDDPVLKHTLFIRGVTAKFEGVKEYLVVFWIWVALKYAFYFLKDKDPKVYNDRIKLLTQEDRIDIRRCIDEIFTVMNCFKKKDYEFPEHTGNQEDDIYNFKNLNMKHWEGESPNFQHYENKQEMDKEIEEDEPMNDE